VAGFGEIEAWAGGTAEGEENPALLKAAEQHAWPLPLDALSFVRRRAAADTVLAYLDRPGPAHDEDPAPAGARAGEEREGPYDTEDPFEGASGTESRYDEATPYDEPTLYDEATPYDSEDPYGAGGGHDPGAWEEEAPDDLGAPDDAEPWDTAEAPGAHPLAGQLPAPRPPGGLNTPATRLTLEEARTLASWDRDLDALAGELRRSRAAVRDVLLPSSLSASQLLRLAADPDGFAQELARPLPRPPQLAARRGTRFHAWVESRFEELPLPMLGPDELPGGDEDEPEIADERDLAALKAAFERSPYARRTPYRVESPFQLTLAGRVIRGRIDAVYRGTEPGTEPGAEPGAALRTYEIVDWKTSRGRTADPLQLAVYRLAWAEQQGVPLSAVSAAFLYVRSGEVVRFPALPGRAELERILTGDTQRSAEEPTDERTVPPADESTPRAG
jgi:DNA helicase-2/ATP-dependent DNA helicase PcrA